MSHPIPICPLLKGEETVMMIIRLGNIFPPLTFPSDFPDTPPSKRHMHMCVCAFLFVCLADAILGSSKKAGNDGASLCFVFMATTHLPWKICQRSYYFPIVSFFPCHFGTPAIHVPASQFPLSFKNITPTYLYSLYPYAEVTLA